MKKQFTEAEPTPVHEDINEFTAMMEKEEKKAPIHQSTKATGEKEKRLNIYVKEIDFKKLKYLSFEQGRAMKDIVEEAISLYETRRKMDELSLDMEEEDYNEIQADFEKAHEAVEALEEHIRNIKNKEDKIR